MKFDKNDTKIMKALAIFLMLYHHLFAFADRINYEYISLFKYHDKTFSYFIGDFGKLCVAIYLFLGGYGTYLVFKNNTKGLIKKKLINFYKSYWKVFIIVIPISVLLNVERVNISIKSLIDNITGWNPSYNGEWWFITAYIILIILSPIFIKLINKICKNIYISFLLLFILNLLIKKYYLKIMLISIFDNFRLTMIYQNITIAISVIPIYLCGMLFAKFKLLDKVKQHLTNKNIYILLSIIILLIVFIIRRIFWQNDYDYIYAPLFIISMTIILSNNIFNIIKKILIKIGLQSTNIWLIHSFFCYHWCQKLIFIPRFSILIFLFLLGLSYLSGVLIDKLYKYLGNYKTQLLVHVKK